MTADRTITDLPANERPDGWPWEVTTASQADRLAPGVLKWVRYPGAHLTHVTDRAGWLRPSTCATCATIVRLIEGTDGQPTGDSQQLPPAEPTPVQLAAALLRGRAERADTLGLTEVGVPVEHLRAVLDAWAATL